MGGSTGSDALACASKAEFEGPHSKSILCVWVSAQSGIQTG